MSLEQIEHLEELSANLHSACIRAKVVQRMLDRGQTPERSKIADCIEAIEGCKEAYVIAHNIYQNHGN